MTGNPFHDENGKFCSKEQMFGAVLRLHQEGDTERSAALFLEYKEASAQAEKPRPEAPIATGYDTTEAAQEAVAKVSAVLQKHSITTGALNRAILKEADVAFQQELPNYLNNGLSPNPEDYNPDERNRVQIVSATADPLGNQEVQYIYQGRFYTAHPISQGEPGNLNRYVATNAAELTPIITPAEQEDAWEVLVSDDEPELQNFLALNVKLPKPHDRHWSRPTVKGATLVGTEDHTAWQEEGDYFQRSVFKMEDTGDLYLNEVVLSSWDDLQSETWAKVQAGVKHTPAYVRYPTIAPREPLDRSMFMSR